MHTQSIDGIRIPPVNKCNEAFKILKRDQGKSDHFLCEDHLTKDRRSSAFVNCLIYMLGIKQTDELLSVLGTSISGLLFGLQPHLPELFADENLLKALVDRLTYNYGIDADLFRGKPIAYDVVLDSTVVDDVTI